MTLNQTFNNWTIITDEPNEELVFEHNATGNRVTLHEDGQMDAPAVSTDEVRNIADHVVETTSELEAAFNNLSAGDTIWVGTPETPYRTTQWLDIDADAVTVVFQSALAENGDRIVKIADGANVGGIRVGHNSQCQRIRIHNYGHHGNDQNQDQSVKRLHGVIVEDAIDVKVIEPDMTRTSPYREHETGGSGVTVRHQAEDVQVIDPRITDIGDRGVQMAGTNCTVDGGRITDGYDRSVSFDVLEPDGEWYLSDSPKVTGDFVGKNNADGSIIGCRGANNADVQDGQNLTDAVVDSARVEGGKKGITLFDMGPGDTITRIENVTGRNGADSGLNLGGKPDGATTVANCEFTGYGQKGADIRWNETTVEGCAFNDNTQVGLDIVGASNVTTDECQMHRNGEHGLSDVGADNIHKGYQITGNALSGIYSENGNGQFCNGYVSDNDQHGINIESGAEQLVQGNLVDQNSQGTGGYEDIRVNNSDTKLVNNHVNPAGVGGWLITSNAVDIRITDEDINWDDLTDNGLRTVLNGVGLNAGDPGAGGDWNGNGYEGVTVRDTTNANTYLYNNSTWSQIASA